MVGSVEMITGQDLRDSRDKFGLGLRDVARFYLCCGREVTVARISQIECESAVSRKVARKHDRALKAAVEWRKRMNRVGSKIDALRRDFAYDLQRS